MGGRSTFSEISPDEILRRIRNESCYETDFDSPFTNHFKHETVPHETVCVAECLSIAFRNVDDANCVTVRNII